MNSTKSVSNRQVRESNKQPYNITSPTKTPLRKLFKSEFFNVTFFIHLLFYLATPRTSRYVN